jgi:hypothetical protein
VRNVVSLLLGGGGVVLVFMVMIIALRVFIHITLHALYVFDVLNFIDSIDRGSIALGGDTKKTR